MVMVGSSKGKVLGSDPNCIPLSFVLVNSSLTFKNLVEGHHFNFIIIYCYYLHQSIA